MQKNDIFCDNKPIYVIDTNILVDYVDIVPNGTDNQPEEPTVDLSEAHLIIPSAVIRELSSFKKERNHRGKSASIVLKRLRQMVEGENHSMREIYELEAPISVKNHRQTISILPVHKNFRECLPFHPSDEDMDGQIILATLTVSLLKKGFPIDGTANKEDVYKMVPDGVVLLTNDNGLAIRATKRGLITSRYGYKFPDPYTGRRDVIVPRELFLEFYGSPRINLELWEELMPSQPKLVANEFIVMSLENENDYPSDFDLRYNPYYLHIGKYDAEEKAIVHLKYANNFPVKLYNAGQVIYAEALMDPNIAAVICTGPAGSGKTYMATVYGYEACKNGNFIGVTVVPCDSHSKTGALPGGLDEKMDPEVQPIKNALRNYLLKEDPKIKKKWDSIKNPGTETKVKNGNGKCSQNDDDSLEQNSVKTMLKSKVDAIWENWFSNIPIENARGRDFSLELAFYDEFQDQDIRQADTLIKRIGDNGKIIITGDIEQIHAPYIDPSNSGLVYASRELFDTPYVAQVCFLEDEVWRHALVKLIAERQKVRREQKTNPENRDE
ncbi:PhoH family protein [Candidatus Saccharibacteria bacterium]|nr:PhoH family protein [Candidatus Saccharibacteria bacterium]